MYSSSSDSDCEDYVDCRLQVSPANQSLHTAALYGDVEGVQVNASNNFTDVYMLHA